MTQAISRITFEPPSPGAYDRKSQTEWTLLVDLQPVATLRSRQAMERLETALAEVRTNALKEAAHQASSFSTRPDRRVHPDVSWELTDLAVQRIAHAVAQQIAEEIHQLRERSS